MLKGTMKRDAHYLYVEMRYYVIDLPLTMQQREYNDRRLNVLESYEDK